MVAGLLVFMKVPMSTGTLGEVAADVGAGAKFLLQLELKASGTYFDCLDSLRYYLEKFVRHS